MCIIIYVTLPPDQQPEDRESIISRNMSETRLTHDYQDYAALQKQNRATNESLFFDYTIDGTKVSINGNISLQDRSNNDSRVSA